MSQEGHRLGLWYSCKMETIKRIESLGEIEIKSRLRGDQINAFKPHSQPRSITRFQRLVVRLVHFAVESKH